MEADKFPKVRSILVRVIHCPRTFLFYIAAKYMMLLNILLTLIRDFWLLCFVLLLLIQEQMSPPVNFFLIVL